MGNSKYMKQIYILQHRDFTWYVESGRFEKEFLNHSGIREHLASELVGELQNRELKNRTNSPLYGKFQIRDSSVQVGLQIRVSPVYGEST